MLTLEIARQRQFPDSVYRPSLQVIFRCNVPVRLFHRPLAQFGMHSLDVLAAELLNRVLKRSQSSTNLGTCFSVFRSHYRVSKARLRLVKTLSGGCGACRTDRKRLCLQSDAREES
jgi:hypothetical protein